MRTGPKDNVVSVINITAVSDFHQTLLITVGLYRSGIAPSSWRTNTAVLRLSEQIVHWYKFADLPYPTCIWRPRCE